MLPLTLIALGVILAVAAFGNGGSDVPGWHYCAAAVGLLGLIYCLVRAVRRGRGSSQKGLSGLSVPILAILGGVVALCVLQVIPLPAGVLEIVSPSSLEIYRAAAQAGAVGGWFPGFHSISGSTSGPISVAPSATIDTTLELLACIVVFALVSDLAAREPRRRWRLTVPFLAVAVLEAVLGILQAGAGSKPGGVTGTYQNHNHFAGLLEMSLPFAAMFALGAWRRVTQREGVAWVAILKAWGGLAAVAAMLLAVAASLSRMGFIATLAGLFVSGAAVVVMEERSRGRRKWLPVAATAGVVLVLAAFLPSTRFIQRFGGATGPGDISSDARFGIWRDAVHLAEAYPVLGCGLGAFQSANMRYQTVTPLLTVNFAHNDYLQLLAELGAVGFVALSIVAAMVYRRLLRNLWEQREPYLYAACLGSLVAIALHSFVDFNLYKPANAMVVAWVAGLAASYGSTALRKDDSRENGITEG
jgi:O-antigen ligase